MALNLTGRDYRILAGLVALFVLGGIIRIALLDHLPFSAGHLILFAEFLAAVALLYGIRKGRRKWHGELARLIDILSISVVIVLVMQALSAVVHFPSTTSFLGVGSELWEEGISAGNALGMFIAAYGFYEFSNAPWFNER